MLTYEMLHPEPSSVHHSRPDHRHAAGVGSTLSERQREVLELLASGVQAREIAARLGLAEATVRNHIRHLLRKLGCHSQLEAVAVAYRRGLLSGPQRGAALAPRSGGDEPGAGEE